MCSLAVGSMKRGRSSGCDHRALGTRPAWTKLPQIAPRAGPITIPRQPSNPCLLLHKELFLRFPYHPFQKPAGNVGVQSMANLPIGRNESVCDVYSSCWPWQAQAAATVAPTHQDTLNPWIQILVNTGFSKRTKATMSHFIVALPTAAPFANPYNNNMWTIDIGRCAGGDAPRIGMGRTS
jgi:hypothetical protein